MTTFVVLFIGLLAVVLILTPLIIHLSREVGILPLTLHDARLELVTAVRDADYHRMASEHASDGLVVQDMKARIFWANPAYLKIFGVTFDEIVGRNPLEFALPPQRRRPARRNRSLSVLRRRPTGLVTSRTTEPAQ
jgi:PAS domain-containing protein